MSEAVKRTPGIALRASIGAAVLVAIAAMAFSASLFPAAAADKKHIDKAADLPRFSYAIDRPLEQLVRDADQFARLATQIRRDTQSVLDDYEIDDKATVRQLLGVLVQLDVLEERYDDALAAAAQVRALQDKPADKLLSGMTVRAVVGAARDAGNRDSEAYRANVAARIASDLQAMPYDVVQNDVKENKASIEIASEGLALGYLKNVLQPTVDKAGALSSELAPAVVSARYRIVVTLPLKQPLIDTLGTYLAAHRVDKPDIWAARDEALPPGKPYATVPIAIWDSGVDTALFRDRTVRDAGGRPALLAFDKYSNPASTELEPIPAALRAQIPQLKSRLKGFSDLQSNIDSPESSEIKRYFSSLKPDAYKSAIEELRLAGNWMHGTHVAGIALAGNPYARLVVARIEFGHTLLPDPCPSRAQALKDARNAQAYVDFMRRHDVRVVNMSWGGSVKDYEDDLELCGIGKTPDDRKALAREYFDIGKDALTRAFSSAPRILFVTAAGNSNSDATFAEFIPAGIVLPNLLTVGAVDKAGDEASFTSYGPTVAVHANGYQVESVIPGGEKVAESGTSMASPQVANLAAKILAVNPGLVPPQVIALIHDTADKSADGRRTLINPKKAIAAAIAKGQ